MVNLLERLDAVSLALIRWIAREADKERLKVYLVGGSVRDLVLRRGGLDLDIVVCGKAISFARRLARKKKVRCVAHQAFGTASLIFSDKFHVDFVSARKERYQKAGALPHVRSGTLEEDLARRDITINAMALALNKGVFGKLVDPYGGLKDIRDRTIRILHAKSFEDDATRILRAVRFEQRFDFQMSWQTVRLLRRALKAGFVGTIKPPRYFAEFVRLLSEENPCKCLRRLQALHGWGFLKAKGVVNLRIVGRLHHRLPWLFYVLALLESWSCQDIDVFIRRFQLAKTEAQALRQLPLMNDLKMVLKKKLVKRSVIYQHLIVLSPEMLTYMRERFSSVPKAHIDQFVQKDCQVKPFLNGHDLEKVGIPEGKRRGILLKRLLAEQLDGRMVNRRQAFDFVKSAV